MTTYTCNGCNAAVKVTADGIERPCKCSAPITAHLTATATGQGSLK
jgi:hypothetical protein